MRLSVFRKARLRRAFLRCAIKIPLADVIEGTGKGIKNASIGLIQRRSGYRGGGSAKGNSSRRAKPIPIMSLTEAFPVRWLKRSNCQAVRSENSGCFSR